MSTWAWVLVVEACYIVFQFAFLLFAAYLISRAR